MVWPWDSMIILTKYTTGGHAFKETSYRTLFLHCCSSLFPYLFFIFVFFPTNLCSLSYTFISPVHQPFQCSLDIHAVTNTGHPQVQVVLLGEGGEVRAVDLIVQELLPVLSQVQIAQPVGNVVFCPVRERLGGKGLAGRRQGQVRIAEAGWWRERMQRRRGSA